MRIGWWMWGFRWAGRRPGSSRCITRICSPRQRRFTTWTLRYNRMFWITVDGLEKHWERARVGASITSPTSIEIKTSNVRSLMLDIPAAASPLARDAKIAITIDGGRPVTLITNNAKGLHDTLVRSNGEWLVS